METPPLLPKTITQKLVTTYLDNSGYAKGKVHVGNFPDQHAGGRSSPKAGIVVSMHGAAVQKPFQQLESGLG